MTKPMMDNSSLLFEELERKKAIAERFGNAAKVYDDKVIVQKQVSQKAFAILKEFAREANHKQTQLSLDIGCGTGSDTAKLLSFSENALGMDLAQGMIAFAQENNQHSNIKWLVADAESLPISAQSVDLIYSSMALQWLTEPEIVAEECFRVMSLGGKGVIAVVLQNSLFELQKSWKKLDEHPPINEFLPTHKWLIAFKNSGFKAHMQETRFTTFHEDLFKVLHSIKDVGAGVVLNGGHAQAMKKTKLKQLEHIYRKGYASMADVNEGELPLSWNIGFLTFEKLA